MGIVIRSMALACAVALAVSAPAEARESVRAAEARAAKAPLETLVADAERSHPVALFYLAKRLFDDGRRDEAVFWFYVGQLRWRAMLTDDSPPAESAKFSELFETIGPDINFYAACDIDKLVAVYDKVLDWDAAHPDDYAPSAKAKDEARAGLKDLAGYTKDHRREAEQAHEGRRECAPARPKTAGGDPYPGDGGALFGTPAAMVKPYDPKRFAALKVGATTKAEAVRILGKPEWWGADDDGTSVLGYSYMRKMAIDILGMQQRVSVSLTFDNRRVLSKLELPKDD